MVPRIVVCRNPFPAIAPESHRNNGADLQLCLAVSRLGVDGWLGLAEMLAREARADCVGKVMGRSVCGFPG